MKFRNFIGATWLVAGLVGLSGGAALAADDLPDLSKETPSGTVSIEAKQFRLLLGGGWGSGTLYFHGQDFPFKVKGLTAGGVGYTEVKATGDVYFLKQVTDFEGKFTAGTIGATVGKGAGRASFENGKGVIMSLKVKSEGLALSLGLGGIEIEFDR